MCLAVALLERGRRLIGRLPAMILLPAVTMPVAACAAIVVAAFAATSHPVVKTVALPERSALAPWTVHVDDFARRLEDAFGVNPQRARRFADWILEASARQQLPPELVASLIATESSFRVDVRSWAGAVGPAQVKPKIWQAFCGDVDLTNPELNVYCGAQILAHYMDRCGEFECALRLYNVGPGNMRKPHYERASRRYLAKVEDHRSRFESAPTF
jgi:soluble lytic murein transglycosylase-like protein